MKQPIDRCIYFKNHNKKKRAESPAAAQPAVFYHRGIDLTPACHALLSSQRFTSYTRISSVVDTSAPADGIVLAGSGGRVHMQRCTVHSTASARALYFKRSTDVASIAASATKERVQNVTFVGKRGATASSAVAATGWRKRRVHFSTRKREREDGQAGWHLPLLTQP